MASSFYFYDLETSGFDTRSARIMEFGGQRTDMNLKPIGKPDDMLIRLTEDVLPDPDAVLTHQISPNQARAEGMSEADFLKYFHKNIFKPNTIMVGYNNIRFDDEFMRFAMWRNFYDPYEWHWKNNCSRWDLLDVVRMTRALRPEGIEWPYASDGKPTNSLDFLSNINKLEHETAHDAVSDAMAAIAVARLLKLKQPKLFDYLLRMRNKNNVAALVGKGEPFVYTSGRYSSEHEKTTIVIKIAEPEGGRGAFVYDLQTDPTPYLKMDTSTLAEAWRYKPYRSTQASGVQGAGEQRTEDVQDGTSKEQPQPATPQSAASGSRVTGSAGKQADAVSGAERFPVKLLSYNRSPALAPLNVLVKGNFDRLKLDMKAIKKNNKTLQGSKDFGEKITVAWEILHPSAQPKLLIDAQQVDSVLYDGFVGSGDKIKMSMVRAAAEEELAGLSPDFSDERLKLLFPLYKARNFPQLLNPEEQAKWEKFQSVRLLSGGPRSRAELYLKRIDELKGRAKLSDHEKYLLEELAIYGDRVIPADSR